ncbi:hypothetical protein PMI09_04441 [Rhizobium sp. CF122]|nr:hypothetical protein PMI09_04441 [Rhizobium sp. CF122]
MDSGASGLTVILSRINGPFAWRMATSRKRLASPTDRKVGSPKNDTPDIIVEIDPDPEPPMI